MDQKLISNVAVEIQQEHYILESLIHSPSCLSYLLELILFAYCSFSTKYIIWLVFLFQFFKINK